MTEHRENQPIATQQLSSALANTEAKMEAKPVITEAAAIRPSTKFKVHTTIYFF